MVTGITLDIRDEIYRYFAGCNSAVLFKWGGGALMTCVGYTDLTNYACVGVTC